MNLNERTHVALKNALTGVELNKLLQDLAHANETDALVRVWDTRGQTLISNETWNAMIQLHNLGKGNIPSGTIHPPADRRRLAPARRLHKICKFKVKK
jgi:hypothetical protein